MIWGGILIAPGKSNGTNNFMIAAILQIIAELDGQH